MSADEVRIGAELLDDLRVALTRYVVFSSPAAADAVTAWTAATHGVNFWQSAPRLVIKSAVKRSGKSRLLDIIEGTCARPLMTANASSAAIFRSIGDQDQPTLLLDEADTVFGTTTRADQNEDLRGLLNAGFGRGRPTLRVIGQGSQMTVGGFPTFAMAALASIGDLPDTIEDRAVVINMRRRMSTENVSPFRCRRDLPGLVELRERLSEWVLSVEAQLLNAEPISELEDRAADVWEPLLAIADAAGGRWPTAVRRAALIMTAAAAAGDQDRSLGIRLLGDIEEIFDATTSPFLASAALTEDLRRMPEAPWLDLDLTVRKLASRLGHFGIHAGHNSTKTVRGYSRSTFQDSWSRYLPAQRAGTTTTDASERPGPDEASDPDPSATRAADARTDETTTRPLAHDSQLVRSPKPPLSPALVVENKSSNPAPPDENPVRLTSAVEGQFAKCGHPLKFSNSENSKCADCIVADIATRTTTVSAL